MRKHTLRAISVGALLALVAGGHALAADHQEAGTVSGGDSAADIGDLYVWHDEGKVRAVLSFAGYRLRTEAPVYDGDVLYQIHFDLDDDQIADEVIEARFGQNAAGDWGVQFSGVPGASEDLVGPVGQTLAQGGVQALGGQFDDPFFFDLQGFQDTLSTGTLSFDGTRDFVAVKNTSAIVIEFDASELAGTSFAAWGTTARR